MSILTRDDEDGDDNMSHKFDLESQHKRAAKFLLEKDKTGAVLATVMCMDGVEDWVVKKLELGSEAQREAVRVRQRRLSEIITQYRRNIPHDNFSFGQVLSWMNTSETFYTLDYLSAFQPDFTQQFLEYCAATQNDDQHMNLAFRRIRAFFGARLADRVFSPENMEFVLKTVLKEQLQ